MYIEYSYFREREWGERRKRKDGGRETEKGNERERERAAVNFAVVGVSRNSVARAAIYPFNNVIVA